MKLDLWKKYAVTLTVKNRLVGGTPTNPDLIAGWLKANMKDVNDEERAKLADATLAQLPALAEERAEGMWTTFKRTEKGIYFEGRNMKAMIKECSNILREMLVKADKAGATAKSKYTNLKSRICVSPKAGQKLIATQGDELKLIWPQEGIDPSKLVGLDFYHFFLQPKAWTTPYSSKEENVKECVRYCLAHPQWRLSTQIHKTLGIP